MPIFQKRENDEQRSILFIHIPKNAGTAVETFFEHNGFESYYAPKEYRPIREYLKKAPTHYDYRQCDELFALDKIYSFAILRNPYERIVSEYRWATSERCTLRNSVSISSFSEFIRFAFAMHDRDREFLMGHIKPQFDYIGNKISRLFRLETGLDSIIAQVLRDNKISLSEGIRVERKNESEKSRPISISASDAELIQKFYALDFILLGVNAKESLEDLRQRQVVY